MCVIAPWKNHYLNYKKKKRQTVGGTGDTPKPFNTFTKGGSQVPATALAMATVEVQHSTVVT